MQLASYLHLGNGMENATPIGGVMFDDDVLSGYVRRVSYDVFRRKLLSGRPDGNFIVPRNLNDTFYLLNTGMWWVGADTNAPYNGWVGIINIRYRLGEQDGNLYGDQIAIGTELSGNAGRMWTRSQNGGTWTAWVEKANKSDMLWSGANTGGDCNAVTAPGCYSGNWTTNKPPIPGNSYGSLLVLASDIATGYRQQIFIRESDNRMWFRASNSLPWQEIPKPATIGTYPQGIAVNSVQPGGPYLVSLNGNTTINLRNRTDFTANDIGKVWTLYAANYGVFASVLFWLPDPGQYPMTVNLAFNSAPDRVSVLLTCVGVVNGNPRFAFI
jgi:hypothetical protein